MAKRLFSFLSLLLILAIGVHADDLVETSLCGVTRSGNSVYLAVSLFNQSDRPLKVSIEESPRSHVIGPDGTEYPFSNRYFLEIPPKIKRQQILEVTDVPYDVKEFSKIVLQVRCDETTGSINEYYPAGLYADSWSNVKIPDLNNTDSDSIRSSLWYLHVKDVSCTRTGNTVDLSFSIINKHEEVEKEIYFDNYCIIDEDGADHKIISSDLGIRSSNRRYMLSPKSAQYLSFDINDIPQSVKNLRYILLTFKDYTVELQHIPIVDRPASPTKKTTTTTTKPKHRSSTKSATKRKK